MAIKREITRIGWREAVGILLLALCVLVLLSIVSYRPADIGINQFPPNHPPSNFIGPLGAWFAFVAFMGLGVAGYLVPFALGAQSLMMIFKKEGHVWTKAIWIMVVFIALICLLELQRELWAGLVGRINAGSAGGVIGQLLAQHLLIRFLGDVGTAILAGALLLISLVFLFEVHPATLYERVAGVAAGGLSRFKAWRMEQKDRQAQIEEEEKEVAGRRRRLENALRKQGVATEKPKPSPEPAPPPPPPPPAPPEPQSLPAEEVKHKRKLFRKEKKAPSASVPDKVPSPVMSGESDGIFHLPSLDLLDVLPPMKDRALKEDVQAGGVMLQETLAEFGVEAEVTNIERGPVITRYELLPAPGVRVERISGLSNNIALAMKAESVRVQAPIPGKGVVGIEVPNSKATMVFLREMLESDVWIANDLALPLVLGKDVGGREIIADLADMPHLLIAGATGSGKTVCMNSILAGLLMFRTPDQMRLILVDPKIVEFNFFNELPHLVVPVITDAKKVGLGLRWAINEMEKRYKLFAKKGVRNIKGYNNRPNVSQGDFFDESVSEEEAEERPPAKLPYIVLIIDELADLMMVAQAEVENSIARLAQLSRAVGIHMILATQRPSVNVITGTIKANFPARIAFQVAQKVDSRTILDAAGADKLLGKGDMLFLPPGSSKLTRAQGTMTSDREINTIVEFIKSQGVPSYETEIQEKIESKVPMLPESDDDEEILEQAIEIIRQTRRASTSSLQRRLRIGYTRAARLMDILEERGVVGPPRGSDPREILIDLEGDIPQNEAEMAD